MNKVFLIGNLTKDPENGRTNDGTALAKFTLAVNRYNKETDFLNISAWRTTAENCLKYLKKGSKVAVVGELQIRSYEASDGTKRTATEIVANEVEFLSTPSDVTELPKQSAQEQFNNLPPVKRGVLPF